ncbi:MAG: hypothetical protein ACOYEV_04095, partial [Candidatus Nanopelagicales bacterium]
RILGPNHPHTLTSRNNLATAHYAAGDLERAMAALEEGSGENLDRAPTGSMRHQLTGTLGAIILAAIADVRAGQPPPSLSTDTPLKEYVATLLAAASGDETARLRLPREALVLLEEPPPAEQ